MAGASDGGGRAIPGGRRPPDDPPTHLCEAAAGPRRGRRGERPAESGGRRRWCGALRFALAAEVRARARRCSTRRPGLGPDAVSNRAVRPARARGPWQDATTRLAGGPPRGSGRDPGGPQVAQRKSVQGTVRASLSTGSRARVVIGPAKAATGMAAPACFASLHRRLFETSSRMSPRRASKPPQRGRRRTDATSPLHATDESGSPWGRPEGLAEPQAGCAPAAHRVSSGW